MDCSRAQVLTSVPRPSSVALLSLTPALLGYIHAVGMRTFGSVTTAWLPQKFMPTKTGAGPWRLLGTTRRRLMGGVFGGPKKTVISFRVAFPLNALGSVRSTLASTFSGGGRTPYM